MSASNRRRRKGGKQHGPPAKAPRAPAAPAGAVPPEVRVSFGTADRWRRGVWGLTILASLVAIVWLAAQVRSVTVPLLVAFAIAYILDPVVDWFEARRIGRTPAILLILLASLVVATALVLLLAPQVAREFAVLPEKLRQLVARAVPWISQTFGFEVPGSVQEALDSVLSRAEGVNMRALLAPAGTVAKVVYGGTVGVLGAVAGAVMVPVFTFYLLRDFDLLVGFLRDLLPRRHRQGIGARFREIDEAMSSFVRGQLLVASILAALYSLGLWLVGLPLALFVGIIAGLGNMIPYLGTAVGVILATLMALLDWQGFVHLLLVYAVFVVVQSLEGWVITPKVVGESVGLSPFVVIVAVLVFGDLFGFFGILIAVPLAAVLKILLRVAVEHYRASSFYAEA